MFVVVVLVCASLLSCFCFWHFSLFASKTNFADNNENEFDQRPLRKMAFVTLVSSASYVPGALLLLHTWHKHTEPELKIDTIALVVPEKVPTYCRSILETVGWTLHNVTALSKVRKESQKRLSINFTKLKLWSTEANLTAYDQVLYVDSDVIVLQAIHSALDEKYLPFAASPGPDFNSGMFTYKPDTQALLASITLHSHYKTFTELMHLFTTGNYTMKTGGEQDLVIFLVFHQITPFS